jgi:hypothetical protein
MPVPDFSPGEVLTAAAMDSIGLWLVKTQTIGTTVSSVTVTDAFSADYDNYKIIINGGSASATVNLGLQLGASTTGYYSMMAYSSYSVPSIGAFTDNNAARFTRAGVSSTNSSFLNLELSSPNLAKVTSMFGSTIYADSTLGTGLVSGFHNVATAYTSFTIIPASGALTGGTIRVYGYRD